MPDQAKHIYQAKLFQRERIHTETFEIEAANSKEAQNRAEAIAQEKGLKDYDFEFTDLTSIAESDQAREDLTPEEQSTANPQA